MVEARPNVLQEGGKRKILCFVLLIEHWSCAAVDILGTMYPEIHQGLSTVAVFVCLHHSFLTEHQPSQSSLVEATTSSATRRRPGPMQRPSAGIRRRGSWVVFGGPVLKSFRCVFFLVGLCS